MAGLPWYAHNIEKYERKTAHLTMVQHGAYRLLMDHYYKKAEPLPASVEQVHRICRALAQAEQTAISEILAEFFELKEDGWHNKQADHELAKMSDLSQKRQKAASGRWGVTVKGDRRQRVQEAKNKGTHTDEEWSALLSICGHKCLKCGVSGESAELTKDHIVPVCKGGSDAISNLQPLCLDCNSARGVEAVDYRATAFGGDATVLPTKSNRHAKAQQVGDTLNTKHSSSLRSEESTQACPEPVLGSAKLPEWVPKQAWAGFVDMRRRIRAALTPRAIALTIEELERLHAAGEDIGAVLDQSTQKSWRGVFAVKQSGETHGRSQPRKSAHDHFLEGVVLAIGQDVPRMEDDGGIDPGEAGPALLASGLQRRAG